MKARFIVFVWLCCVYLSGCTTTYSGRGVELVEDDHFLEAVPHFEVAADEGSMFAHVMLGFLYISNYQIPQDIEKARGYLKSAREQEYSRYDQMMNYFMPLLEASIVLKDETDANDGEAVTILRGNRYSTYGPALVKLARSYALGAGIDKNTELADMLFKRAMRYGGLYERQEYAYWLTMHPDATFRQPEKAIALLESKMHKKSIYETAQVFDTLAVAYSQLGQFDKAIELEQKAISMLQVQVTEYPYFQDWIDMWELRIEAYKIEEPVYFPSVARAICTDTVRTCGNDESTKQI